jgi:hypothetical protein
VKATIYKCTKCDYEWIETLPPDQPFQYSKPCPKCGEVAIRRTPGNVAPKNDEDMKRVDAATSIMLDGGLFSKDRVVM